MISIQRCRFGIILVFIVLLSSAALRAEDVGRICGKPHNRAIVSTRGLVFRVPEPWYWRPQDIAKKFHLTRAKLDAAKDGQGEWDKEFGEVCHALFPFRDCVAHVGSSGWPDASFNDLQVRAYVLDQEFSHVRARIETAGAAEVKRLSKGADDLLSDGSFQAEQAGPWTKFEIRYPRWYWDYGGTACVDCFIRPFGKKTVGLAFMYVQSKRYETTIPAIVDSAVWLDENATAELFAGQSQDIPGKPIDPPPPSEEEIRQQRIAVLSARIESEPENLDLLVERAKLYSASAKQDEAIADFDAAHQLAPDNKALAEDRAREYLLRGNAEAAWAGGNYQQAVADLTIALRWYPDDAGAYYCRGAAWRNLGEYAKSIADYDTAIRLGPKFADACYSFRGLTKLYAGDNEGALADLNRAIELEPTSDWWLSHRAEYWMHLGQYKSAVADLVKATELDRKDPRNWTSLTWIYASCVDPSLRDADRALEAARAGNIGNGGWAEGAQAFAAAHAAARQFEEAVKWQEIALGLVENAQEKAEAESRLKLYKSGKPFYFTR